MHSYHLNICDVQLDIRTEADPERMERARQYVDDWYGRLKAQGGQTIRERLLIMMLISMADDFLQMKDLNKREESAVDRLLRRLEEHGPGGGAAF
ncbi:MAG: cell division protein ZapA [Mailhella sp.]|nr:cell division protein ZapA [Mailhella sp.]